MLKEYTIEILLLLLLATLAFGFFNPYYMPMGMVVIIMGVLVVLFTTFVVLMWREKGGDEREEQILHKSDRIGFFAGATILITAVIYDTLTVHYINDWVVVALFLMVFGKVISLIYYRSK